MSKQITIKDKNLGIVEESVSSAKITSKIYNIPELIVERDKLTELINRLTVIVDEYVEPEKEDTEK